ncbi:MAG TPA: RNA polymerase sigma factor RpoD/SigA, partial [Acidimicrobiales bacterium]|nr:RNA polymerase sigma factor RpoD/SigA [Acidimicrobiales bacterium]
WWIRQAITRGIDKSARTIRLPVHVAGELATLRKTRADLELALARTPTEDELADELGWTRDHVSSVASVPGEPTSLDAPLGDGGGDALDAVVADPHGVDPADVAGGDGLAAHVERLLGVLSPREQTVLRLRYGLYGTEPHTLDQAGRILGVSRERVRQIERRAMEQLRLSSDHDMAALLAS